MSITSSTIGKRTFKIILLGDSCTGKTSIIERFVNNKFQQKDNPTIGIDFLGKNITNNNISCRLQLWDTAGQQRYRSLIPSYLKDAVCAIFIFDVSRLESLRNLENWIELFRQNRGQKSVMIVCGNKNDLSRQYDQKYLTILMQKYHMKYYQVSALNGLNIENMFISIIDEINIMQQNQKNKIKNNIHSNNYDIDLIPPLTTEKFKQDQQITNNNNNNNTIKVQNINANYKLKCCQ